MKIESTGLLLTTAQMRDAEARAMKAGITGWRMMQAAGGGAAELITRYYDKQPTLVLCGPGNNGGDGFVVAEALRAKGWPVAAACLTHPKEYTGDAKTAADAYRGEVVHFDTAHIKPDMLIVDALFGTGLTRPLEGAAKAIIEHINAQRIKVVAVDIPSGVHGDTGEILGAALRTEMTVTFAAKKPGHLLLPGKALAGELFVIDIGIHSQVKESVETHPLMENRPELWLEQFPWPQAGMHKYARGSAIVVGGPIECTGAARLAATAAARITGAVSVACDRESLPVYASHLTSIMTKPVEDARDFIALLKDERHRAIVIGPGNGVNKKTRAFATLALEAKKSVVLDADALSVFAGSTDELFSFIHSPVVMTPHEGEFRTLFDGVVNMKADKLTRTREATKLSGAVVLLKGGDTVIAAPDGRVVINANAPADLATAGAGDVLAGMITGLLACGMEAFAAACAAAWIHGETANRLGPGLLAEDLPEVIPGILQELRAKPA